MKRVISLLAVIAMVIAMVPNVFAAKTDIDYDELIGKLVYIDSIEEINVAMGSNIDTKIFKWTPDKTGTLSVYYYEWEKPEGAEVDIVMLQGENSITYSQVPMGEEFALKVEAGVPVSIIIKKTSEAALEMWFYGDFVEPLGAEGNPITLFEMENTINAAGSEIGTTTWYQTYMGGTTMTITGTAPFNVIVNGEKTASVDNRVSMPVVASMMMGNPFVFGIEEQGEYQISFAYPVGSDMNPAQLVMGENTAVIEAGTQGYYYTWTAEKGGKLTITMPDGDWTYQIHNRTSGVSEDIQWSDSDPVMSTYEVNVLAGDEIQLIVNTFDPENPNEAPASTLVVTAAFEEAPNSESNPIVIAPEWNDTYTSATATVTVSAGTTYYGIYNSNGMMLSIDGAEPFMLESDDRMPAVFAITNEGTEEKEYTLLLTPPLGSYNNPAPMIMGENTATIAENSWSGYLFTWTAETDGKLTITMPEGDWSYVVNNITSGAYGDSQTSDMDPVQASTTVDVKAGDEIQVNVNTYNPDDMWNTPAGTLVVTAAFEEVTYTSGDLTNDGEINSLDGLMLMRYLNGWDVEIPSEEAMDVNGDGEVNSLDGLMLMRYLNGWDVELG